MNNSVETSLKNTVATIYQLDEMGAVCKEIKFSSTVVKGVRDAEKQKEMQISQIVQSCRNYFKAIEQMKAAGVKSAALDWRKPVHFRFEGRQQFDTAEFSQLLAFKLKFNASNYAKNVLLMVNTLIIGSEYAASDVDNKMSLAKAISELQVSHVEHVTKQKAIRTQREDAQIAEIAGLTDEQAVAKKNEERIQWIERQKQINRFRDLNKAAKQAVSLN